MSETKTTWTDAEKLQLFAREVSKMLALQQRYFKISSEGRKGAAAPHEVRQALANSKAQESKVKKITEKILTPQTQMQL